MFSTCCHQVRVTWLEKRLVTRALAKVSKVSKVLDSLICQVLPIFYSPQLKIILTFENQSFPGTTLRPRLPHSREGRKCTRSNCSTGIAMSKTAKKGEFRFFHLFLSFKGGVGHNIYNQYKCRGKLRHTPFKVQNTNFLSTLDAEKILCSFAGP